MVSRCFGYDDLGQFGIKWLIKNFIGEISEKRVIGIDLRREESKQVITFVKEDELNNYRYYHPYMYKRKLTNDIINKFDIGYDKNTNCITFPVRDENGNCLFVARRSVVGKFFNYPTNIEKPVYALYELYQLKEFPTEIYITESMINALTLWTYGLYAVALNGTGTQYQIEQLKKLPCRKMILALDPDDAGKKGANKLYNHLKFYKVVTFLKGIPRGKDINDLSEEEFKKCYEIF